MIVIFISQKFRKKEKKEEIVGRYIVVQEIITRKVVRKELLQEMGVFDCKLSIMVQSEMKPLFLVWFQSETTVENTTKTYLSDTKKIRSLGTTGP